MKKDALLVIVRLKHLSFYLALYFSILSGSEYHIPLLLQYHYADQVVFVEE